MKKYNRFMEIFWLVVAIATATYAVYTFIADPNQVSENTFLFVMPFIAAVLFMMRRYVRLKQARREQEQEDA